MAWHNRFKQKKACEKEISEQLMSVAWHPTKWWDWCISKDEKKEIDSFLIDEK